MIRKLAENRAKRPIKLLFICSGNAMRSPTAEMLFEQLLNKHYGSKWREAVDVASGAVRFKNNAIFKVTRQLLLSEGIPEQRIDTFRPRHMEDHPQLFADADIIIPFTDGQTERLLNFEPSYVSKILMFSELLDDGFTIPDPWFSFRKKKALRQAAEKIKEGLIRLLKLLEKAGLLTS